MSEEKEVIIDLSKKIKFSKNYYVSLGSLLLSLIMLIIQLLMCLCINNWVWTKETWLILFNFAYSLRHKSEEKEDKNNSDSSSIK